MKEFDIVLPVRQALTPEQMTASARRALGLPQSAVPQCVLVRRSLDARGELVYRYRVAAYAPGEVFEPFTLLPYRDVRGAREVIVIGAGPAGMFAALRLLMRGLRPVVLERGKDVHARKADMAALSKFGTVDPDSNYCFGEGGAGAFSDGKLFTRSSKRGDLREVLHQLVAFGADSSILTEAHPHIGSDKLPVIVENIRRCIVEHGGEYHFGCRVCDISRKGDGSLEVSCTNGERFCASRVILASGHSARDIYELFRNRGWALEAKGFALGVRAEHPQQLINRIQYHGAQWEGMPAAEYSFVEQVDGRGVFSFCMCPGGILVPSSTEDGTVVLNGMSNSARNSKWANAGVVVSIEPGDEPAQYASLGPLALLQMQHDVEKAMYMGAVAAGSAAGSKAGPGGKAAHPLAAPAQRMKDFCRGIVSRDLPSSSYFPGCISAPLHELLPQHVASRLRKAFPQIDRRMHGYYTNDALLLGVESRTSSPVRIPRDKDTLQHPDIPGLLPCGEGAGYSGGIVSSALDGIACADACME